MNEIEKKIDAAVLLMGEARDLASELRQISWEEETEEDPCPWYTIALKEEGVKEVKGSEHNPRILEYLATTKLGNWGKNRDETPWCAAFVNWCLSLGGREGTDSARARSYLGWGVDLVHPKEGCIVVLRRGKAPAGHVTFYDGHLDRNRIRCFGGNQNDQVKFSEYARNDVLSYRWPE